MVRIWHWWVGNRTVSATETVDFLSLRRTAISSESGLMDGGGNSDVIVVSYWVGDLRLLARLTSMDPDTLARLERR